jgi:hypothetical protein
MQKTTSGTKNKRHQYPLAFLFLCQMFAKSHQAVSAASIYSKKTQLISQMKIGLNIEEMKKKIIGSNVKHFLEKYS